jgi:hypothetical protein
MPSESSRASASQSQEEPPSGLVQNSKSRISHTLKADICGYGCLDHFLENDTYVHSWEMLCRIISHEDCQDILLDIGMYLLVQALC